MKPPKPSWEAPEIIQIANNVFFDYCYEMEDKTGLNSAELFQTPLKAYELFGAVFISEVVSGKLVAVINSDGSVLSEIFDDIEREVGAE